MKLNHGGGASHACTRASSGIRSWLPGTYKISPTDMKSTCNLASSAAVSISIEFFVPLILSANLVAVQDVACGPSAKGSDERRLDTSSRAGFLSETEKRYITLQ